MDDLREIAGRALHDAHWSDPDFGEPSAAWESCVNGYREEWLNQVDIVIAAIEASGHRIVPVEPTEEMVMAGIINAGWPDEDDDRDDIASLYRAMLTAYGKVE